MFGVRCCSIHQMNTKYNTNANVVLCLLGIYAVEMLTILPDQLRILMIAACFQCPPTSQTSVNAGLNLDLGGLIGQHETTLSNVLLPRNTLTVQPRARVPLSFILV